MPLPAGFLPFGDPYAEVRLLATTAEVLVQPGWAQGTDIERLEIQTHRQATELFAGMRVHRLYLVLGRATRLPTELLVGTTALHELRLQDWPTTERSGQTAKGCPGGGPIHMRRTLLHALL